MVVLQPSIVFFLRLYSGDICYIGNSEVHVTFTPLFAIPCCTRDTGSPFFCFGNEGSIYLYTEWYSLHHNVMVSWGYH